MIVNPNGRIDSTCSFHDETKSIILNACRKKLEHCCEHEYLLLSMMTMKHFQEKYMKDHLTFDWRVYFSRPIRFSRTLVCGLFKNQWFSCRRYFKVLLPIDLAASPLAFSGSADKTLFRVPTIPPATRAITRFSPENAWRKLRGHAKTIVNTDTLWENLRTHTNC